MVMNIGAEGKRIRGAHRCFKFGIVSMEVGLFARDPVCRLLPPWQQVLVQRRSLAVSSHNNLAAVVVQA